MVPPSCRMPETAVDGEGPGFVFHYAAPAFNEANELIVVVENAFAYCGADDRIKSGAVAAAG